MAKLTDYSIYALVDPRTNVIRYVGKCVGPPHRRLKSHLYEAQYGVRHNHRLAWMRSLFAAGLKPYLSVLEGSLASEQAGSRERDWIAYFRSAGVPLTNGTVGGEGMPNPSESTRAKLRARPRPVWTLERSAQQSARMKRRWAEDSAFQAAMAASAATRRNPKARVPLAGQALAARRVAIGKMMGALNSGTTKTPAHRAKLAEATRKAHAEGRLPTRAGTTHSEETRQKMREAWVQRKARRLGGDAQ